MGKNHITVSRDEQLEIDEIYEASELFGVMDFKEADSDYQPDLCDSCTKLEGCPIYDFKKSILECSNYGKPN